MSASIQSIIKDLSASSTSLTVRSDKSKKKPDSLEVSLSFFSRLEPIILELQQLYRYMQSASSRHSILFIPCSIALQELEKLKGDTSGSTTSRQRYPKTSFESLLSTPSPSPNGSNGLVSPALAAAVSEVDAQQLQLHVAALELQVSTLRDALSDAQDQCSLFEKQCNWFKKMELELQLSRDRNSSASDLDYLRRLVASSRALCPAIY
jgi:hypothetical protein